MKISDLNNPAVESINALDYGSKLGASDKVLVNNILLDGWDRVAKLDTDKFYDIEQLAMSFARSYTEDVYDNSGHKNGSRDQAFTFSKVAVRQMHIDAMNAKIAEKGFKLKTYINPNGGFEGCRAEFCHGNDAISAYSEGFIPENDMQKEKYLSGFMETTGAAKLDNWRTVFVMPNLSHSNPSSLIGDFSHTPEPNNQILNTYGDSFSEAWAKEQANKNAKSSKDNEPKDSGSGPNVGGVSSSGGNDSSGSHPNNPYNSSRVDVSWTEWVICNFYMMVSNALEIINFIFKNFPYM